MSGFGMAAKEYVKKDQDSPDKNGGIRDIKSRVTVSAKPYFEKIRDRPMNDAIGDISGSAAQQKCQTREGHAAAALAGNQQPGKHGDDYDGADDQNDARGGGSGIGENAESETGVSAVHEIHKVVD